MALAHYTDDIFVSTDSGATWNPRNTFLFDVINAICSADGTRFAAVNNQGMITVSTNQGTIWSKPIDIDAHSSSLKGSADLVSLVAVVPSSVSSGVATSTNMGMSWVTNSLPATNWSSVAISADGSKLVAAAMGGPIYSSSDRGATWFLDNAPSQNWQAVASSADGNVQFAVAFNGGIWVKRTFAAPTLRITGAANGQSLSWIVPSASVALQESHALDGVWIKHTNTPTLNLSHLTYESVITPVGNAGFYRLKLDSLPN